MQGAKELMVYAAEHGGSHLFGWYTFFYIAKSFIELAFDILVLLGIGFLIWMAFLFVRKQIREQRELEAETKAHQKRREDEETIRKQEIQRMRDKIRYT